MNSGHRTSDLKDFGRRLRDFLRTEEAYEMLDAEAGGTWTAGGCWILARALGALLGAPLVAVWDVLGGRPIQHHVVVQAGTDCYLDADGAHTEAALLRKIKRTEMLRSPYIAPFNEDAARDGEIVCPVRAVQRLRARLVTLRPP